MLGVSTETLREHVRTGAIKAHPVYAARPFPRFGVAEVQRFAAGIVDDEGGGA